MSDVKIRVEISKETNDLIETLVKVNNTNKSEEVRKALKKHIEDNIDLIEKQIETEKQKLNKYKKEDKK